MISEAVPAKPAPAVSPGASLIRLSGSHPTEASLAAELAQERHIALELQHAILPLHDEPFDLPGLRTVVRYLPASRVGLVGGDWYITAEMPGRRVLLAIGDVGGHGLAAAAGMARLRGALAGLAITGAAPNRLVGWLNDLVWHVSPEHTASVIAGYFDPCSRILTWAQAGHPAPVLVRDGAAALLDPPEGVLLGAGQGWYGLRSLQLRPADLLLLYSDGLVERRDRCIDEGIQTLISAVHGCADPELMATTALQALGPGDTHDDTCLVAIAVR